MYILIIKCYINAIKRLTCGSYMMVCANNFLCFQADACKNQ